MKTRTSGCLSSIMIFLIFGLVGGGLAFWGWTILQDARASTSWPTVEGTIISSRVTISTDSENGDSYKPDVIYRYRLDDQIFDDNQIKFGENSYGNRRTAEQIVANYPQGKQITIYYEPDNPSNSVLEPGITAGSYLVLGLGLFFLAITLITIPFRLFALIKQ